MSIPVPLDDLAATLAAYPWGYLVTVGDEVRAHLLAVPTDLRDGVLHASAGRSTRANLAVRPEATMVFPHPTAGGYSLLLDGTALVAGDAVTFTPLHAILHRPALT
ncbi:MAG: hypothetical protein WCC60_19735, partial [Ilumatobacteraceae bacterium]